MGINHRAFLKGLAEGLACRPLAEVLLPRQGWAGFLPPAKTREVFLFPATDSLEKEGRAGISGRWVQRRYQAVKPAVISGT